MFFHKPIVFFSAYRWILIAENKTLHSNDEISPINQLILKLYSLKLQISHLVIFAIFGKMEPRNQDHQSKKWKIFFVHSLEIHSTSLFTVSELFFGKKYLLVGTSGMLRINGWVRDVCMSHQSDWIYYKQPIKFLVVKVDGLWEDLILLQFRLAKFYSPASMKEEEVFIYWAYFDIFCGLVWGLCQRVW